MVGSGRDSFTQLWLCNISRMATITYDDTERLVRRYFGIVADLGSSVADLDSVVAPDAVFQELLQPDFARRRHTRLRGDARRVRGRKESGRRHSGSTSKRSS